MITVSVSQREHFNRSVRVLVATGVEIGVVCVAVLVGYLLIGAEAVIGIGGLLASFSFGRLALGVVRSSPFERHAIPPALQPDEVDEIAADVAKEMGLPIPNIAVIDDERVIATIQVVNSSTAQILLNERIVDNLTGGELRAIIAHEMAHMRTPLFQYVQSITNVVSAIYIICLGVVFHNGSVGVGTTVGLIVLGRIILVLISASIHRHYETRADDDALEVCRPVDFARALRKITEQTSIPLARNRSRVEQLAQLFENHPAILSRMERAAEKERFDVVVED